jgi:hypothetical protein
VIRLLLLLYLLYSWLTSPRFLPPPSLLLSLTSLSFSLTTLFSFLPLLSFPLSTLFSIAQFINWLTNGWVSMAMTDYPYPTSFLEPMNGWPVNASCNALTSCMDRTYVNITGSFDGLHAGNRLESMLHVACPCCAGPSDPVLFYIHFYTPPAAHDLRPLFSN